MKPNGNLNEIRVDLHMHTDVSDGTWTPERLLTELVDKGIKIFSVTDHNSVENIEEVCELAKKAGMIFIPGVEIDVTHNERGYHMLGYGVDIKNRRLLSLIERNRISMEEKDDECIKFLEDKGRNVSVSEYKSYANNRGRGGWKALNYLIDAKLCSSPRDFFELFDEYGNPFDRMTFASPKEAVSVIIDAGGIPVLAHPGASFYDSDYKRTVSIMLEQGIRGIECFHPENSMEITGYCLEICRKKGLLVTGGSDCHGSFVPKRRIGLPDIRLDQLNLEGLCLL